MSTDLDFEQDAQVVAASTVDLALLDKLVKQQLEHEARVADLEEQLKRAKDDLRQVQERDLPEAMEACNTASFTTTDGFKVEIKEDLTISLAGDKKQGAMDWLREAGHGDMITADVILSFGKGREQDREACEKMLRDLGYSFKQEDSVNSGSVKAMLRRKLEAGETVDLALFGGFRWKKTKISLTGK